MLLRNTGEGGEGTSPSAGTNTNASHSVLPLPSPAPLLRKSMYHQPVSRMKRRHASTGVGEEGRWVYFELRRLRLETFRRELNIEDLLLWSSGVGEKERSSRGSCIMEVEVDAMTESAMLRLLRDSEARTWEKMPDELFNEIACQTARSFCEVGDGALGHGSGWGGAARGDCGAVLGRRRRVGGHRQDGVVSCRSLKRRRTSQRSDAHVARDLGCNRHVSNHHEEDDPDRYSSPSAATRAVPGPASSAAAAAHTRPRPSSVCGPAAPPAAVPHNPRLPRNRRHRGRQRKHTRLAELPPSPPSAYRRSPPSAVSSASSIPDCFARAGSTKSASRGHKGGVASASGMRGAGSRSRSRGGRRGRLRRCWATMAVRGLMFGGAWVDVQGERRWVWGWREEVKAAGGPMSVEARRGSGDAWICCLSLPRLVGVGVWCVDTGAGAPAKGERKQRRVRGRVVMHMPAVSSATDLLPQWRGRRGERAAVAAEVGACGMTTRRTQTHRRAQSGRDAHDHARGVERNGSVVSRVQVQVLLRLEKSVSVAKSVLAGGESEGSTPDAADGRGRGKGARTVARGYVRRARATRARQGRREGAMPMRTPLTRYVLCVRGEDWCESTTRMLTRPDSSCTCCTPVLSPPSLLVPVLVLGQSIVIALVLELMKRPCPHASAAREGGFVPNGDKNVHGEAVVRFPFALCDGGCTSQLPLHLPLHGLTAHNIGDVSPHLHLDGSKLAAPRPPTADVSRAASLVPSPSVVGKWTLAAFMRNDGSLQRIMEAHYDEFITEQDIVAIAGAGLNWVRLPIPFWSIRWTDIGADAAGNPVSELFLQGMWWKYIVRLLGWACKYSIRVNLDLRTAPGSQNDMCAWVEDLQPQCGLTSGVDDARVGRQGVAGDEHWG
ncbi:hypothetical protein B0H14DRAFT_3694018 [Mycena olivaceomarginata]|nr:hypothetical protein B0H14DRAFT_3694018 [Mycena olivaceomarginata]